MRSRIRLELNQDELLMLKDVYYRCHNRYPSNQKNFERWIYQIFANWSQDTVRSHVTCDQIDIVINIWSQLPHSS